MSAWMRRGSLARKLTGISILTSAASLVVAAIVLVPYDRSRSRDDALHDTQSLAQIIAGNSTAALAFGDVGAARAMLLRAIGDSHIVSAAILSRDGRLFAHAERLGTGLPASLADENARAHLPPHAFRPGSVEVMRPIELDGEIIGTVFVAADLDEMRARMVAYGRMLVLVLIGASGIAWLLASRLQRVISTPLVRLAGVTRAVSQERRYDLRAEAGGGVDEISELIAGFNEMLDEIQTRDRALLRHQVVLEQAVEARTAELRDANADLSSARDRALDASRAKSEFLANMSHEIRTPMNGMLGMTELVLDSDLTTTQREWLTTIRSSSQSLLSILNDILDFSKIEARKLEFEVIPFTLEATIKDLLRTAGIDAGRKGIELRCELDPAIPAAIVGDPGRLRQVLSNLVGNAIKFTDSGHVLIRVCEETRTAGRSTLHFTVSDTGIGIPSDKEATIFEAFSQADSSTTRRFGGTGLGLTISARLVGMMGGQIRVESVEGVGSTFHVIIPFDTATLPAVETAPAAGTVRRAKVLVVDDNLVNQRVAVELLTRRGHVATVAGNGRLALEALERGPFDVVLMDIQMPVMGGIEATAAIRLHEQGTGRHQRIVAMTAHTMTGDREQCLAAGMDDYLSKPIHSGLLFAAVEGAVPPPVPSLPGTSTPRSSPPIDHAAAMARMGGDVELFADVSRMFLEMCPAGLSAIKAAIDGHDAGAVRATAHALRGAAANLSAGPLCRAAEALERMGAESRLDTAETAWRLLAVEADAVMETLRTPIPPAAQACYK